MAGFDRTGCRFGDISSPKRPLFAPPPPRQIACRICKSLFLSAHSLIDHMGTHLVEQTTTLGPTARLPHHKPYDFHFLKPTTTAAAARRRRRRSPSSCNHFLFDISTPTRLITNPNILNTASTIIPPRAPQRSVGCTQPLQFASLLGVKRHLTGAVQEQDLLLPQKQRKLIGNETVIDLTKSDVKQLEKGSNANNGGPSELETLDLNLKL